METLGRRLSAAQATTALVVSTPLHPPSTPAGLATSAPWAAPFLNAAPTAPSSSTQMRTTATCAPLAITVTPTQVSAVVFSGLALFRWGGRGVGMVRCGMADVFVFKTVKSFVWVWWRIWKTNSKSDELAIGPCGYAVVAWLVEVEVGVRGRHCWYLSVFAQHSV